MAGFDQKTGHVMRDRHGRTIPAVHVTPKPESTPQEREQQVREIVVHRTAVQQHQSTMAARGRVVPEAAPKENTLPLDPVSATLPASNRNAAMIGASDTASSAATAAKEMHQQLVAKHQAAQELVRRANPDYDPQQARQIDEVHGDGSNVYQKDPTTLLLNSIGYTGNNTKDFNATVARVNDAFQEAYGQPPTPGLLLDVIRSPAASDPMALRNLFAGKPATSLLPADAAMLHHTGQGPAAAAQLGKQKGLAAALRASVYGNNSAPLISAAQSMYAAKNDTKLVQDYVNGESGAQVQMGSMIPVPPEVSQAISDANAMLRQQGTPLSIAATRTWQENERIFNASLGNAKPTTAVSGPDKTPLKYSAQNAFKMIAGMQQEMNAKYNLGLKVSGVIDDTWAKAIVTLSHTRGYGMQVLAQNAANAGFGAGFDSFKAIDVNGGFANNSDGRAAKLATQQFINAQHGQSKFLSNYPLATQFGASMPLQWFNNGGMSVGAGLSWVFGGGNNGGFNFQYNPFDFLAQNMAIPEHALFRGGLSGFDAFNGGYQTLKTDAYAGEAFGNPFLNPIGFNPSDWTGSDMREAAKRLSTQATWLDLAGQHNFAAKHGNIDFITNMLGDVLIARKWGGTGETVDANAFATAASDAKQFNDLSGIRALMRRGAYAKERVGNAWKLGKQGKVGEAAKELAGQQGSSSNVQATIAYYGKNWVVDNSDSNPWKGTFPMTNGDELRPLTRAESEALQGRGISAANEHEYYTQGTPEDILGPGGHLATRQWAAISAQTDELKAAGQDALDQAHEGLRSHIESLGLHPMETQGVYGGDPEKSFFVPGMTQAQAMQAGKDFGQESVLTPKGLAWTTGDHAGEFNPLGPEGHTAAPGEADNMSTTHFGGEPVQWKSDIPGHGSDFHPITPAFMKDKNFGEIAHSGLPQDAELYRWHDLIHDDHIDEETHNNIAAHELTRLRILDSWRLPQVPAQSRAFLQPMQRFWIKGRGPTVVPHPLLAARGALWEQTSHLMDWADRSLYHSNIPGDTFLDSVLRNTRAAFTKAPNPHTVPLIGADPRNVFRMAMNAGVRSETGTKVTITSEMAAQPGIGLKAGEYALPSSKAIEKIFMEGIADSNPAAIQKAEEYIKVAAISQGRMGAYTDAENAFSAYADSATDAPYLMNQRDELAKLIAEHEAARPPSHLTDEQTMIERVTDHMPDFKGSTVEELRTYTKDLRDEYDQRVLENKDRLLKPLLTRVNEAEKALRRADAASGNIPRDIIGDMRDWVSDLQEGQGHSETATDDEIINHVKRTYDGGLQGFMRDSGVDVPDFVPAKAENTSAVATEEDPAMAAWQAHHERLQGLLTKVTSKSRPGFESEMLSRTGVPQLLVPKDNAVGALNNFLKRVSLFEREGLLVPDAALFSKHGVTDSLRRLVAEGPGTVIRSPAYRRQLAATLAENPEMKARFDTLRTFTKDGEARYDMEGAGRQSGPMTPFWSKENPRAAAEYIDRRLMSGAYQAWKIKGKEGVREWFLNSPAGQRLAESEGFGGDDQAWFLAHITAKNLDGIEMHSPGFLKDAEQVRNTSKDSRKALEKFIKKGDYKFPVSGHVSNDSIWNLARTGHGVRAWDAFSQAVIGKYLIPNKWNRGGLFHDLTAKLFHDYTKAGADEQDALNAAMSHARVINRYHMLDLADALKVEQNIRWGALFFTKHRLYWTWLMQTMKNRPELALAAGDLAKKVDSLQSQDSSATPGVFNFHVPWRIPGLIPPGMSSSLDSKGMEIAIPWARLLWLTEASNNPGPMSNVVHDLSTNDAQNLLPFRGNVNLTTIDSTINTLILMADRASGRIHTSQGVLKSMGVQDQIRFQGILARVQGGYFAQHHHYLDDASATDIALKHMLITSFWSSSAFTGSYPNDERLTPKQDKAWKAYNQSPLPAEREKIRRQNPWIDTLLGAYNGSPQQHTQEQQLWDTFARLNNEHDANLNHLLADSKTNPDKVVSDLFGKAWYAEQDRYTKALNGLVKQAKAQGADHWVKGFNGDHFLNVHTLVSASLHQMYGIPTKEANKVAEAGRPTWLKGYRAMLYGPNAPLSDAAIAKLPADQQQAARETAANYKAMIRPWNGEPSTNADKVRNNYLSTVYTDFVNKRDAFFQKAATDLPNQAGVEFDKLRAFYDSVDHPVTVNGIEMPSPLRVHFAMLPPAAQQQYTRDLMTKQWQWLSGFDKSLLGVKVPKSVQDGWTYYNDSLYQAIGGPAGAVHKTGKTPTLTPQQQLIYAWDVQNGGFAGDTKGFPGFYADYVRTLQPVYVTMAQQKIGKTPAAQQTWQQFLGKVQQIAQWGANLPYTPKNLPNLLQYNANLRTGGFQDLLSTGRQGVLGGTPVARPPDSEYPKGGYLYQWAMAQPNHQFQEEFKAWVTADPQFMVKLFGTGA